MLKKFFIVEEKKKLKQLTKMSYQWSPQNDHTAFGENYFQIKQRFPIPRLIARMPRSPQSQEICNNHLWLMGTVKWGF